MEIKDSVNTDMQLTKQTIPFLDILSGIYLIYLYNILHFTTDNERVIKMEREEIIILGKPYILEK